MNFNKKDKGMTIYLVDNNVERAIRKLKKISAPLMKELRDKRYFVKKSLKNQERRKKYLINAKKNARELNAFN